MTELAHCGIPGQVQGASPDLVSTRPRGSLLEAPWLSCFLCIYLHRRPVDCAIRAGEPDVPRDIERH